MGLGGVSVWQLLIIFAIVILVFGTSRLKSLGGDLGGAIKGFRKEMESEADSLHRGASSTPEPARIEGRSKSQSDPG
jgi:sec-independent protein translocase protein TatA